MFLSCWLGRPDLYTEQHGHPRLRSRHFPFKIGTLERDQGVACLRQACAELEIDEAVQKAMLPQIYALAEWMRNQDDAIEGAPMPPMYAQQDTERVTKKLEQLAQTYNTYCSYSH